MTGIGLWFSIEIDEALTDADMSLACMTYGMGQLSSRAADGTKVSYSTDPVSYATGCNLLPLRQSSYQYPYNSVFRQVSRA